MSVEIPEVADMTAAERRAARARSAMASPEHMARWLRESGREWLVFNGIDLVKSLPWPAGHDVLMNIIHRYREYRSHIDSGRSEYLEDPISGEPIPVVITKTDELELAELDRAIRTMIGKASALDPEWSLSNSPL